MLGPAPLITLTGTGVPHPAPGRAGAGTLVRSGDLALQFDAGRSTVMRLVLLEATLLATLASFLPARRAVRVTVQEVLTYE